MSKTVRVIIIEYLKSINADGLVNTCLCGRANEEHCGCALDALGACNNINIDECVPARFVSCKKCEIKKSCIKSNFTREKNCFFEIKGRRKQ
jgi:hypothetical protein